MTTSRSLDELVKTISLVQVVNYAAAAFALAAAVFWFISASVRTPTSFSIDVDTTRATWDGSRGGSGSSLDLLNLGQALRRQSRWSSYAAICAAVAAVLGAFAFMLSSGSN
jgi:hypothetical protein